MCGTTVTTAVEIWFQHEAWMGQKGAVGSRPPMARDNRPDTAYIVGAICPARGVVGALTISALNMECMNLHLAEISAQVATGSICAPIDDGAGWHQRGDEIKQFDNIALLPLPPYSPELNPMANALDYLCANILSAGTWDGCDVISEGCGEAWNWLANDRNRIRSIGTRKWATVSVWVGRD